MAMKSLVYTVLIGIITANTNKDAPKNAEFSKIAETTVEMEIFMAPGSYKSSIMEHLSARAQNANSFQNLGNGSLVMELPDSQDLQMYSIVYMG